MPKRPDKGGMKEPPQGPMAVSGKHMLAGIGCAQVAENRLGLEI